jgi:O-antigen/teichoic acid export membrane protein
VSLTKKLFTGSALQTLNLLFDIAIGFVMMPFLITNLGESWYGLWLLVGSIIGFLAILTLGLSSAVQRYLSIENTLDKQTEYNQTLNSSLAVFIIASLLAIVIASVIALLPSLFISDVELIESFKYLVLLMGLNIAISFISSPFRAILATDYKFSLISAVELITILSKAGLSFLFITMDYNVVALGVATLIGNSLGKSILIIYAIKLTKKIRFSLTLITKHKLIILFKYSSKTMLAWLGDVLRFSVDNIVITAFVGLTAVTIYNLPLRLYNYASQFIITSLGVLQPFFSQKAGEKDGEAIRHKFELACGVAFALGAILAAGLFVFGYEFISLWIGEYEEVKTLIYIFPAMILLATSQNPCILILYSHNKHEYYAYQNIAEGVLNAIISIIAVHYIGIIGVALGSLIPMLITKIYYQPRLTCQLIGFSLKAYYKQMFVCYTFVLMATLIGISLKTEIQTWFELVLNIAIFCFFFVPLYWFMALNTTTKVFLISKLKPLKKR